MALCVILCISSARANDWDDVDRRPRLLYVAVQNNNCVTTCRNVGLRPMTGSKNAQVCAYIDKDADEWMVGIKRSTPRNRCQVADDDDDDDVYSVDSNYWCGCLPNKGGKADGVWVSKSANCAANYAKDPHACRIQDGSEWYVGHFDDDDDECIYFFPADERNRRAKSSGGAYQRLCVTRRFAYLGIEDDD